MIVRPQLPQRRRNSIDARHQRLDAALLTLRSIA
jgi:hypothetical protein